MKHKDPVNPLQKLQRSLDTNDVLHPTDYLLPPLVPTRNQGRDWFELLASLENRAKRVISEAGIHAPQWVYEKDLIWFHQTYPKASIEVQDAWKILRIATFARVTLHDPEIGHEFGQQRAAFELGIAVATAKNRQYAELAGIGLAVKNGGKKTVLSDEEKAKAQKMVEQMHEENPDMGFEEIIDSIAPLFNRSGRRLRDHVSNTVSLGKRGRPSRKK